MKKFLVFASACLASVALSAQNPAVKSTPKPVKSTSSPAANPAAPVKSQPVQMEAVKPVNPTVIQSNPTISNEPKKQNPTKEAFTQQTDDETNETDALSKLSKKLKTDEAKLNDAIQAHSQLDTDDANARHLLLYSRIKFGVAVVLGLLLAYFAFRFLTADELPTTIATELAQPNAGATMDAGYGMDDTY